jgi:DNA-directed RNA polymerase sigma subunit (sigma70/sigma32)
MDFQMYGQDLVQEGWLIVYRKKDSYVPRGAKFSTYIYDWIQQYMKTYALKELRASSQLATEETEERLNELEAAKHVQVDFTNVDPLLILAGMGYTDEEIEATGRTDVARRRRQAQRQLKEERSEASQGRT